MSMAHRPGCWLRVGRSIRLQLQESAVESVVSWPQILLGAALGVDSNKTFQFGVQLPDPLIARIGFCSKLNGFALQRQDQLRRRFQRARGKLVHDLIEVVSGTLPIEARIPGHGVKDAEMEQCLVSLTASANQIEVLL